MPFTNKTKPGMLSRMFNKAQPQPATLPSMGEKTLDADGEVLDAPAPASRPGLFSSRRAARPHDDIVDVDMGQADGSAATEEPAPAKTLSGMFKDRKSAPVAEVSAMRDVEQADDLPEAGDVPVPPVASKYRALFGKKAASSEPAPARAKSAGFFSRKAAPAEKAADAAPKATAPKKKAKPAKKGNSQATSLTLLTELGDTGKTLLWSLTGSSLAQLPAAPVPDEVVSFSKEDIRFHTEAAMTYAKALDMAIEEIGEMVAIVNRSKELSTIYCTRDERAMLSPYRIGAGQQALDLLLRKTSREGQSLVTGFSLKDEGSPTSVVVLYYVSADGESSKPQVTVNPDNMEFVLNQFTSSRKINRKETEVVLFTNEDLLSVAGDIKYFADEKVWNGIPVRVLQNAGAGITGLIAAGAVGWAVTGFMQKQLLVSKAATAQARTKALTEKNSEIIEASLYSFSSQLSQDPARIFALAQKVWVPTSKVTLEAKSQEAIISVVLPLVSGATYNNGPSVNAVTDVVHVRELFAKEAPEGCTKSNPQTTGNLNEIRIDIICQTPDSALHGYRGD
jgi:hypothetical protein